MAKITSMIVFEMLGKPAEHVEETMKKFVDKIGAEPGLKLANKKIHDVREVENIKGVFSTFAELDVEFDGLNDLMRVLFTYMPAHMEIYSPENITLSNNEINFVLNDILRKLHNYDEIAKRLHIDKTILENKIKELEDKIKELSGKTEKQAEAAESKPTEEKAEEPKKKSRKKKTE